MKKQVASPKIPRSIPSLHQWPQLQLILLLALFSLAGCSGVQWRYQGEHFIQDVKSAQLIRAPGPDHIAIGTLRGRAESRGRKPKPFEDQATRQAARRGGHAIVHLSSRIGHRPDNPKIWVRTHVWSVFRKKK